MSNPLLTHWYFHLPNFVLAALMYTLLGRALLGLIVDGNSQNYIWRFFCRITDPVVAAVAVVTPKAAAPAPIAMPRESTAVTRKPGLRARARAADRRSLSGMLVTGEGDRIMYRSTALAAPC